MTTEETTTEVPASLQPAVRTLDDVKVQAKSALEGAALTRSIADRIEITFDNLEQVRKFLLSTKHVLAATEEHEKTLLGPFENMKRNIKQVFGKPLDDYRYSEEKFKEKLAEFKNKVDAARALEAAAGAQVTMPPIDLEGVRFTETLDFEIVTEEAVPRQFCTADRKKITEYRKNGGLPAIPGVKFFPVTNVVASKKGVEEK